MEHERGIHYLSPQKPIHIVGVGSHSGSGHTAGTRVSFSYGITHLREQLVYEACDIIDIWSKYGMTSSIGACEAAPEYDTNQIALQFQGGYTFVLHF